MEFELDHFFILTEPGAPAAALLIELGLEEGSPNEHPGQGTANRRFFFTDAMLELLYPCSVTEPLKHSANRLRFADRLASDKASPFGLILRARTETADTAFPGWRYYPSYLEAGGFLVVGENSDTLVEPLCVLIPSIIPAPDKQPKNTRFSSVSGIQITVPHTHLSPLLKSVAQCERVSIHLGAEHLMEIIFNHREAGRSKDFRPGLPLIIHW